MTKPKSAQKETVMPCGHSQDFLSTRIDDLKGKVGTTHCRGCAIVDKERQRIIDIAEMAAMAEGGEWRRGLKFLIKRIREGT